MRGPEILRRYSGQAAFLGAACAAALLAVILSAAGRWAFREFSGRAVQYQAYHSLQRNVGRADSLSGAYAALLGDLESIRKALPPENQASYVLNVLVDGAKRMELGISGITALDPIPFPGYVELPFELGLTGGFPNLVRYLHSLETQGMVLRVRRLSCVNETLNRASPKTRLELSVFVPGGGPGGAIPENPAGAPAPAAEASAP